MSAARTTGGQPRPEGGREALPSPVRPPALRGCPPAPPPALAPRLARPSPAALRSIPPRTLPQPEEIEVRQPLTHRAGRRAACAGGRAATGGASKAHTAAPAARAADQAARGGGPRGGTCRLSQPRASPGTALGPPARRRQVPPRGASALPATPAVALAAGRAWPRPTLASVGCQFPSLYWCPFFLRMNTISWGSPPR